ncbi:MAG: fumarylacetoacetate hydrolase family protein [Pigmentiphaga sp.]|nr:fumarylacetoacetate hydrolase family protein [Pigmentiphaga sp.]
MKLGTALIQGRQQVAVLIFNDELYDANALMTALGDSAMQPLGRIAGVRGLSTIDLIENESTFLLLAQALEKEPGSFANARLVEKECRLIAPIPRPAKNVFCLGRNYADHIQEDNDSRGMNTELPKYPQFFTKPPTSVIGPDEAIVLDEKVTRRLDYEVELAVVIGRGGRDITAANAMDHVFGYTVLNDVTARDLQRRHDQWFKGKALDTSCPMGPFIVHASSVVDPHDLRIQLYVNDELRQDANTSSMIFKIPQIIESLSAGLTLEPGDIIATGTPSGVGYAMDPRQFLKAGDLIRCHVEKVGTVENVVRPAPSSD